MTVAQRVAEVEVIFVAVGEVIVGGVLATQTPPLNVYPLLQIYSHFIAVQLFARERVTFEASPVSSHAHMVALVGTVH